MHVYRRRGALALALVFGAVACSDSISGIFTSFQVSLSEDQVTGLVAGTAAGASGNATCTMNAGGVVARPLPATTTFACPIGYAGLSGNPTAAQIHTGAAGANGATDVWLCGGAGAPAGTAACPASTATTTAALTAVFPAAGISPDSLYGLMVTANASYLIVTTAKNPANGEIRGTISHPLP
jgi:hypothetical protein